MSVTPVSVKIEFDANKKYTHSNDKLFYAFHVFLGGITCAQPTFYIYDLVNKETPS